MEGAVRGSQTFRRLAGGLLCLVAVPLRSRATTDAHTITRSHDAHVRTHSRRSAYYNYYDPLTGAYFKDGKKGGATLKARGVMPGPPQRGAPVPPLGGEDTLGLTQTGAQEAPRSAQMKSWWSDYFSAREHQDAIREHYRSLASLPPRMSQSATARATMRDGHWGQDFAT